MGQPAAQAKKYALLVGVNQYDFQAHFADLKGAVNDVTVLGKLLKDNGYEVVLLKDAEATRN